MMKDTVRNYVRIELLPPTEQPHLEQPITRIEQNQIVEDIIGEIIEEISSDSAPEAIDSILPGFGGVVRIYFPVKMLTRFFPGYLMLSLITAAEQTDSPSGDFRFFCSPITLKINGTINAENRTLSALDFIDNWTSLLRKHQKVIFCLEMLQEYQNSSQAMKLQ